jgi:hypothetical protein
VNSSDAMAITHEYMLPFIKRRFIACQFITKITTMYKATGILNFPRLFFIYKKKLNPKTTKGISE